MDWSNTRRDEKHFAFGIRCGLYQIFDVVYFINSHKKINKDFWQHISAMSDENIRNERQIWQDVSMAGPYHIHKEIHDKWDS